MFRKVVILSILFQCSSIFALEITKTEKTAQLIHIWGMAKYLHPAASDGKVDMDTEFLELSSKLNAISSAEGVNEFFIKWIDKLNNIDAKYKSNTANLQEDNIFKKNADYRWIEKSGFTAELIQQLKKIQNNANIGNHYAKVKLLGNTVDFSEDEKLNNFDAQNETHRLLFLASFWNAMRYWNVNIYLTEDPWEEVLQEMIPQFSETKNFNLTKDRLFAKLDDSHANYTASSFFSNRNFKYFAPISGKIINDSLVITEILAPEKVKESNLEIGDVIFKVNGKSIAEIIDEFSQYISTSNENYLESIVQRFYVLGGKSANDLDVKIVKNSGEIIETEIERYEFPELKPYFVKKAAAQKNEKRFYALNNETGYINLGKIKAKELKEAFENYQNKKAIILDLRNYPKNISADNLANLLYPEKSTFIKVMAAKYPSYAEYDIDSALKLIKNPFKIGKKNKDYYKGKIILLVNSSTGSMSEFFAMAIQNSPNCTTLGEQTFGAVMNRMAVPLKDGTSIDFTGFGAFYPDDTSVQRKGLKIDHYLKKSTKNYTDDFYIEEALKLIDHSL